MCLAYNLFRKALKDDPELQWDRIVNEIHTKDPWEDLRGVKHNGICGRLMQSMMDCIELHKLTMFTIDAPERHRFYMMCSIKKPMRYTIQMHVTQMETLNK